MAEPAGDAATDRFVLRYALAWAGGMVAYTPLLTVLLPVKVAALAGEQARVDWLATIALVGAVAASLGGILFGYLSDITRNRRGWIAAGLVLSCGLLQAIGEAQSRTGLICAIALWQLALNMMLGPLAALAGDVVPDDHKGRLGGLMAFAPGLGALSGAVVTLPWLVDPQVRLMLIAAMVVALMLPVLWAKSPPPVSPPSARTIVAEWTDHKRPDSPVLRMWGARLAVQVSEAALFSFLYFWLVSLDRDFSDNQTARLLSAILLISAPLALWVGRWSDSSGRPITPLTVCALAAALGLLGMALAPNFASALFGYAIFGLASGIFLALHSAQTLRILPRPSRRGRDLGLFNLANTTPSLVMPWLAMAIVPLAGFRGLFGMLAGLAVLSAILLRSIDRQA
ncbi:MAG: MFS transporter [Novosphingobium sp.]